MATATATATGPAPERAALANDVCGAFVTFAREGQPALPSEVRWPPYSLAERHTALFNTPSTVASDPDADDRQAWAKID